MEVKPMFKFLDFTVTQSMSLDNPVYQIIDVEGNVCTGSFDNLEDLVEAIEMIENLVNLTIEYIPLTRNQI